MYSGQKGRVRPGLPFFQRCDSNFNPRSKVLLESTLAKSVVEHFYPLFAPAIKKVIDLILPDLNKALAQDNEPDSLSAALFHHLYQDVQLQKLMGTEALSPVEFRQLLTAKLQSAEASSIHLHAVIIRLYLIFFMTKGQAKPAFNQAVELKWSALDLQTILADTQSFRGDLFKNNLRRDRHGHEFMADSSGILPANDPAYRPFSSSFDQALFAHDTGLRRYRITTHGNFTRETMFKYNMPAICGPSGMVALYLGLANQVSWSSQAEKHLYNFFMCFITIYVGGHSLDECFSIGRGSYNRYVRGNYDSILDPEGLTIECRDTLQEILRSYRRVEAMPLPGKSFI